MDSGYDSHAVPFLIAFVTIWLIIVGVLLAVAIVVYILNGFAFMRLFRKVGVEPWAAWVPIFNNWRLLEVGGQPGWASLLVLVPSIGAIVSTVFIALGMYRTGIAFRKSGGYVVLGIFFPFAWAFVMGADETVYEPDLIRQAGYGPPLAGFGSARGPQA
jgi:hypothetical protein